MFATASEVQASTCYSHSHSDAEYVCDVDSRSEVGIGAPGWARRQVTLCVASSGLAMEIAERNLRSSRHLREAWF
jgi:hypothetical protein